MIRSLYFTLTAVLAFFASYTFAEDLPEIEVIGNKFFFKNNGTQFLMRGIAYQQNTANNTDNSFHDPLADTASCKRDIPYLQKVATNVIRVYAVNTSRDHTECMTALNDAGIYVILDLSEPDSSINRYSPEWNLDLYERYTGVVDAFHNYTNILGFFAGNEVTNAKNNTDASAFVKAAVRDTKQYIADKDYRTIPVGYSSNDDAETRVAIADYFSCGSLDDRADFFGINMYEWCGDSTFETSGYEDRTKEYSNLTIPVFFSEYGCNAERPRKFTEVGTLFSNDMTDVWSGGIVYMYFEEENDYGLVSLDGSKVLTLGDYSYYSKEINLISPTLAQASAASASASNTLACPAEGSTWSASPSLPPTPDKDTCDCIAQSLSCVIKDNVDSSDYGDLYGTLCGLDGVDCSVISANGTSGVYGGVSFCKDKDKLSYLLNQYYESNDKHSSACDFDGSASINESATTASSCSSRVAAASSVASGSSGTGSSGSGSSSSGSGSGSQSSSTSSSTKKSSALNLRASFSSGELFALAGMMTCFLGGLGFMFV